MGHLRADSEAFGALKLTESARGVLKGETEVWLREQTPGTRNRASRPNRGAAISPRCRQATHAMSIRLCTRALRAWRSDVARKRGVPAYVVLHDSTIDGIARAADDAGRVRGIAGIGDKKLEHYGEELMRWCGHGATRPDRFGFRHQTGRQTMDFRGQCPYRKPCILPVGQCPITGKFRRKK